MRVLIGLLLAVVGCSSNEALCGADSAAVWHELSGTNAPRAQLNSAHAWTGTELLIWGGETAGGVDNYTSALNSGGRFDPVTRKWTPISTTDAPSGRSSMTWVWTGTELIVWGGLDENRENLGDGARYDPALDQWTPMSTSGAPSPRRSAIAVWTGSEMMVVGGVQVAPLATYAKDLDDGAIYNPATDSWRSISLATRPDGELMRRGKGALGTWTGSEAVFWGYEYSSTDQLGQERGWIYTPSSDEWRTMSSDGEPYQGLEPPSILTTQAGEVLAWGVESNGAAVYGGRYNVAEDSWSLLPEIETVPVGASATMAGDRIVAVGREFDDYRAWMIDPITGNSEEASPFVTDELSLKEPVAWTGTEAIIWFGNAEIDGGHAGATLEFCPN